MVEITADAFSVQRFVRAVQREDHIRHLEGVPPSAWQATPCKRLGKVAESGLDLACRGTTSVNPDGSSGLL